jgi:pimeloyl-ACP methyl ester carboxylesterase
MDNIKIFRSTANVNNIDIFYRDTKTKGSTILCLHGRWGRGETWIDFIQHYGDKYRVIAPDQRGHGLSGKPISKYTAKEMAADMVELLKYLKIDSIILVGHSMGGHIAGYLAASYPEYVQALAILDKSAAGPENQNTLPLEKLEIVDPVTKDWPLPFPSLIEAQNHIRNAMESDLSYQYFMNSLIETIDGYQMMFSSQAIAANIAYYANWYNLLPRIKCPVMLVKAGGNDAVSDDDFRKMQSMLSDCMPYKMTNPDHNVHLSNKNEFYRYFDDFLNSLRK